MVKKTVIKRIWGKEILAYNLPQNVSPAHTRLSTTTTTHPNKPVEKVKYSVLKLEEMNKATLRNKSEVQGKWVVENKKHYFCQDTSGKKSDLTEGARKK